MGGLEAIKLRRSVRTYSTRRPSKSKLRKVLEAARLAPSGANRQPLIIVVVDDPTLKARIRRRCEVADSKWWKRAPAWFRRWARAEGLSLSKTFLTSASHLLCVFGERSAPYWLESAWVAIGYMTLAATSEGLGCLTYTPGNSRSINSLLGVPQRLRPIAVMPVGYAEDTSRRRPVRRKKLFEIVHVNRYGARFG